MSNFTGTTYRNVSRSYLEFQQFYESVIQNNPQTIVPALPLARTSAPTDEEDDRLVKIMLQRWLTRVCEDPILIHEEELRSFIESDFGYQPTPNTRKKVSSGFSLIRRGVPDEDEELQRARFELTKMEGQFFDAAKAIDKLARARKCTFVWIYGLQKGRRTDSRVLQPLRASKRRWEISYSTSRRRRRTPH